MLTCDKSALVKNTSGALFIISSSLSPKIFNISGSSPSIRYSTAEKTGGPVLNLSMITLRFGFCFTIDCARSGRLSIMSE